MSAPYTRALLRLAAEGAAHLPLSGATHRATRRTVSCGSRIALDLTLDDDGRVRDVGYDLHACAFGQASSALFARGARGRSAAEITAARDELKRWLAGDGAPPEWPEIGELAAAARALPGRHGAVTLPFDAAVDALADPAAATDDASVAP